ncbi:MAG: hypothetical protein KF777_01545 [Planctomycetaceae bacterium]|nr:hypothetical protein [Planctomycetaceae bacterium]
MANHSEAIAEIEEILRLGVKQTVVEGLTVVYDHDTLRRELARLKKLDDATQGLRPLAATILLDGAC